MFDWYFKDYFIENKGLFYVSMMVIVLIILLTVFLVYKELRKNHVNK